MRSSDGVDSWVTALPRFHTAATPLPPSPGKTWDESLFVASRPKLSVGDPPNARTSFPHASTSTENRQDNQRHESLGEAGHMSLLGRKADESSRRSSWLGRWLESRDDTTSRRRSGRFSIPSVFLAPQSHSGLFKKEVKRRQESQPSTTQYRPRSIHQQEVLRQPSYEHPMNRFAQTNGDRRPNDAKSAYTLANQQIGERNSFVSQARSNTPSDRRKASYENCGADADTSAQTIFETQIIENDINATSDSDDAGPGVRVNRSSRLEQSSTMLFPSEQRQQASWFPNVGLENQGTKSGTNEYHMNSKSTSMPFLSWPRIGGQVEKPTAVSTSSHSASPRVYEADLSQNRYVADSLPSSYPWFSSITPSIPALTPATTLSPPTTMDCNERDPLRAIQRDMTESHSSQQYLANDTLNLPNQHDQSYNATSKFLPQNAKSRRTSVNEVFPALNPESPSLRNARHWSMPSELAGALFSPKNSSPVPAPAIGAVDGRAASPFLPARLTLRGNSVTNRAASIARTGKPHRWSSAPAPTQTPYRVGSRRILRQLPPARTPPLQELPPIPAVDAGNFPNRYAEFQLGRTSSMILESVPSTASNPSAVQNTFRGSTESTSMRKNANEVFGLAV